MSPLVNGTYSPVYTYTYDSGGGGGNQAGRLAQVSYRTGSNNFDQVTETYGYTPAGLVSSKTMTVAYCTQFNPNVCGYASPLVVSATYDNEGRRATMTTPVHSFSYSYDSMDRVTGMTDPGSGNPYVNGIQYNAANQMTNINYSATAGGALTYETRTYNSLP